MQLKIIYVLLNLVQNYFVDVKSIPDNNEYRLLIVFGIKDQIEPIEFETFLTRIK